MSQPKRDSVWWGSLIVAAYGVAFGIVAILMWTMYLSNPILPEEAAKFGFTYAEIQTTNPYLASYIWWVVNAWVLPYSILIAFVNVPIAWKAVRNRQKWAWYTLLFVNIPFWLLFYAACYNIHTTYVQHWLMFTPFFALFIIGMILPARQLLAPKDVERKI